MPRSRSVLAGMLALLALALTVPAVSLAGGSAGDQQYTDPFAGASGGGGSHAAGTTTSAPTPATVTPAHTLSSPATPTSSAEPITEAAVATIAGGPTATTAGASSATLPHTGYDAWTAVGFGLALVAGGGVLRWRLHARRA